MVDRINFRWQPGGAGQSDRAMEDSASHALTFACSFWSLVMTLTGSALRLHAMPPSLQQSVPVQDKPSSPLSDTKAASESLAGSSDPDHGSAGQDPAKRLRSGGATQNAASAAAQSSGHVQQLPGQQQPAGVFPPFLGLLMRCVSAFSRLQLHNNLRHRVSLHACVFRCGPEPHMCIGVVAPAECACT